MSMGERLVRVFWSFVSFIIALIPFWFWLAIKHFAQPQGFWQNLALAGLGLFFLGTFQFVFLILWMAALFAIWE